MIVVITLLGILIAFTAPRFQQAIFTDDITNISRWIMVKIPALKEKAVREQRRYTLHLNLDSNTMWITNESMSEEESQKASQNGYVLPENYTFTDVEFTGAHKISSGLADIRFYKQGYSDRALIHIEDNDYNRISFVIEPFLSGVKRVNQYVEFEG